MLKAIFLWWEGATIGARFDIGRRAAKVGSDDQGNTYYEERKPSLEGRKRRYVIYKGYADASKVPPGWRGCSSRNTIRRRRGWCLRSPITSA